MKALGYDRERMDWDSSTGFELVEVQTPRIDEELEPSDATAVLIKVYFAGVCGSDKGIWYRQSFRDQIRDSLGAEEKTARIIGHECFGQIVAMGSRARDVGSLAVGDFVSAESHLVCNVCAQCTAGQKNVCINEKIMGISTDGCFAEYVKLPVHVIWKTDTNKIRPEVAAVQEPFGNAVHACSKVPLTGKTIAIFGLGPIGLFSVLVARGFGAHTIIGIDPNPVAREMAQRLGIDYCISVDSGSGDALHDDRVVAEVLAMTGGFGVDVAFEMAGFNASVNNAIRAARRGGDVILFGIKSGDFVIEQYDRLIVRGLTLHAVIGREVFATWEKTRGLLEDSANKIADRVWNVILGKGEGTLLSIDDFSHAAFEEKMRSYPKFLIQF